MDLIIQVQNIWEIILKFIFSIHFIIFLLVFIILYHISLFLIRDRSYIVAFKNNIDPKISSVDDLIETPLVNIIVPAWKEGEIFAGCLLNLSKLSYPNLNVIVNAGGSERTLKIANSFKNYENFIVIYQEKGGGKIKAINDCLSLVSNGIICLIDADIYLSDEHLLKMLYIIVNKKEKVVISDLKPHTTQLHKYLVRYLYINRTARFNESLTVYSKDRGISPCTLLVYDVINKIGTFTEKQLMGDGKSMGLDILNENYKIYQLKSDGVESFNYPDNLKEYFSQNIRWIQNRFFNKIRSTRIVILSSVLIFFKSLLLFVFPFFAFLSWKLFFLCILVLISMYMKKVRKIFFFKSKTNRKYFGKNSVLFYFFIIFYIYLDALINIYTFFELLILGKKNFKKRKNY